jgi:hypothetical protein
MSKSSEHTECLLTARAGAHRASADDAVGASVGRRRRSSILWLTSPPLRPPCSGREGRVTEQGRGRPCSENRKTNERRGRVWAGREMAGKSQRHGLSWKREDNTIKMRTHRTSGSAVIISFGPSNNTLFNEIIITLGDPYSPLNAGGGMLYTDLVGVYGAPHTPPTRPVGWAAAH